MAEAADSKVTQSGPNLEATSFEESFRQLGEMVESLENGGLPLAQATDLYRRGMELVQRCNQLLNEAQLKITQLQNDHTVAANGSDWAGDLFQEP